MKVIQTQLPGCLIIEPQVFGDARGFLMETWNRERYLQHGIGPDFVQSNLSYSERGVLRGLHYQWPNPQGKLVSVVEGEVFDVAVDIRKGSPHFGQWSGVMLTAGNRRQAWIPEGFAHGFVVVSESAQLSYLCTSLYDPAADANVAWNDADIGIDWPASAPTLSQKDAAAPCLKDIATSRLPEYSGTS